MSDPNPDTELTLSFDNQRAVMSLWGAFLRRYYLAEATAARRHSVAEDSAGLAPRLTMTHNGYFYQVQTNILATHVLMEEWVEGTLAKRENTSPDTVHESGPISPVGCRRPSSILNTITERVE